VELNFMLEIYSKTDSGERHRPRPANSARRGDVYQLILYNFVSRPAMGRIRIAYDKQ
jgi:hypothetical protein